MRSIPVEAPETPPLHVNLVYYSLPGGRDWPPTGRNVFSLSTLNGAASCNQTFGTICFFKVGLVHPYVRESITHHK